MTDPIIPRNGKPRHQARLLSEYHINLDNPDYDNRQESKNVQERA